MKTRSLKLIFAMLVAGVGFVTLIKPQSAAAACGPAQNYGVTGGSSDALAGLVVTVKVDGVLTDGITFKVASTDTYNGQPTYSVVYTRNGWASYPGAQKSASFSSGSTFYSMNAPCRATGLVVLGYGTSGSQGNGWTLDCKQVMAPGTGFYEPVVRTSHFQLQNISNPAGKTGAWSGTGTSTFTANNGNTTYVDLNFTTSAPKLGIVQGLKVSPNWVSLGAAFNAKVDLTNSLSQTANAFSFGGSVPAGTQTLTAETPYKGQVAFDIKTSTDNFKKNLIDYPASSAKIDVPAGGTLDVRIFYKPLTTGYVGYLDTASCSSITGWAENLALPAGTISVNLKSDGNNLTTIPAGTYRSDVGNHSFSFAPPASLFDGATHVINGFMIKTAGGTQELTYSPMTLGPCNLSIPHKIFNINFFSGLPQAMRDNETFPFNLLSYMFPDTGAKGAGGLFHLWLSGVYPNNSGVVNSDSSNNASLDAITSINAVAELGCRATSPASCKNRVPLAYVPKPDKNGNATPNGNVWLALHDNAVPTNTYGVYDPYRGGFTANNTINVGGFSGVHLNLDEISNIHVGVTGITTDATGANGYGQSVQGLLDNANADTTQLQADARQASGNKLNLPTGSQGPQGPNVWDNVRNPNIAANVSGPAPAYSASQNAINLDFKTPALGTFNNATSAINNNSTSKMPYLNGTATSLLQDGQGGGYRSTTEPLTLTAGVTSVGDVNLKWDEYVDWTQVDNKGHYYPTSSGVNTGYQMGNVVPAHYVDTPYFSGGSPGYETDVTIYYCYTSTGAWDGSSYSGCPSGDTSTSYTYATNYQVTQTIGCASASVDTSNFSWATPNQEFKFGWYNSSTKNTGSIPTGGNGGTVSSAFGPSPNTTPNWAVTGNNAYWQDPNVTTMNTSGATPPLPTQSPQWKLDTSDPLYTNRMIYDGSASLPNPYNSGVTCKSSSTLKYWTNTGSPADIKDSYTYIADYYPNAQPLYENSPAPTTQSYGKWGAEATFDGSTDGSVMTGWAWSGNPQRVHYENTWFGRSRDLGSRTIYDSDASDKLLYGPDFADGSASQPARGSSIIYNPTISGANGDIFSGGDIGGYFKGNNLAGAYLFANGSITNFTGSGTVPYFNYFNNPSTRSGTTYGSGATGVLHHIFPNFDATIGNTANQDFSSATTPGNLNKAMYKTGSLTLGTTTFCNRAGTIYVKGDLIINGNLSYCGGVHTKDNVPSVGFVVKGDIIVAPGVTSIVGTYVATGSFATGSVFANPSLTSAQQRSSGTADVPFTLNGSMIASSYNLQRQLSGSDLMNNLAAVSGYLKPENFNYDGRVVVSPPPGFNSLNGSVQAVLNEAVPRN